MDVCIYTYQYHALRSSLHLYGETVAGPYVGRYADVERAATGRQVYVLELGLVVQEELSLQYKPIFLPITHQLL